MNKAMRGIPGSRIRDFTQIVIYTGGVLNYMLVVNQAMRLLRVGGKSRKLVVLIGLLSIGLAHACREALRRMREVEISKLENAIGFKGDIIAANINSYFPALQPLDQNRWMSLTNNKIFDICANNFTDPKNISKLSSADNEKTRFLRDANATHLFTVTEGVPLNIYSEVHQFSYSSVKSSLRDLIKHLCTATGPISPQTVRIVVNTYTDTLVSVDSESSYVRTADNLSTDVKGLGSCLFLMCTNVHYSGDNTLLVSRCAPSRFSKLVIDMLAGSIDVPEIKRRIEVL